MDGKNRELTSEEEAAELAKPGAHPEWDASQWGWEISKEQADYLRAKYLFEQEEEPFLPTDSML